MARRKKDIIINGGEYKEGDEAEKGDDADKYKRQQGRKLPNTRIKEKLRTRKK